MIFMKKVRTLLIACLMILGCVSFPVTAKADGLNWSDDTVRAAAFSSRDDSSKTIEIASAEELGLFAYEVNQGEQFQGYTIKLTADIDLSGYNWDPIGHYTARTISEETKLFKGTFDGGNHTIKNMYISIDDFTDGIKAFGLFGGVYKGSVKNLHLTNAVIQGESSNGIVTGILSGFSAGSQISNCSVTASEINVITSADSVYAGGFFGSLYDAGNPSTLNNLSAIDIDLAAVSTHSNIFRNAKGGIVGYGNETRAALNNCYARDITIENKGELSRTNNYGLICGCANYTNLSCCFAEGEEDLYYNLNGVSATNCSKASGNKLEIPVTINGSTYETLVGAMNAWIAANSGAYTSWDCDSLGVDHVYQVKSTTENTHILVCLGCSDQMEESHKGGTATCRDQAVCSICQSGYGELDKTNHVSETVLKNQKSATCTEEGYTGDTVCAGCGEMLETGTRIAKLSHNYKDGICTMCGASETNHQDATQEDKNSGNVSSPRTGDETPIVLWIGILVVACVAILGIVVYRKKQKKN